MRISVSQRLEAIARAKQALSDLSDHQGTTTAQLGAARDQLNLVHNLADPALVWDAVKGIEDNVLNVYGRVPSTQRV